MWLFFEMEEERRVVAYLCQLQKHARWDHVQSTSSAIGVGVHQTDCEIFYFHRNDVEGS